MIKAIRQRFARLRRDERGTYLMEFAALSLPLSMLLMGGIELGYLAYAKSHTEGTLREVARLASTGSYSEAQIDAFVDGKLDDIAGATVTTERKSYSSFQSVAQPEPLVSDVAPLGGTPGTGDCYLDINGNGQWDADQGTGGLGASEDIVYYGVTVTYPVLFPLTSQAFGRSKNMQIEANAVIKNEPFGSVAPPSPATECIA